MSVGDLVVGLESEDLTASELERRYLDEVADLKVHRDPERTALRLAALLQSAVHRLRMEESRAGSHDLDRGSDRAATSREALGYALGGGWRAVVGPRPGKTKTSLRPH